MHTTVIIPCHYAVNPQTLAWTLEGYAQQQLSSGHTLDIRIGIDGADGPFPNPYQGQSLHQITVHPYPQSGAAAVRNFLVKETTSDTNLLILGNADARPDSDMVQKHADAMAPLPERSLVLGAAPWERIEPKVIDVLIDAMPMIFSYCHMRPQSWYQFRCAYSLNLSVRRKDFLDCGGFHDEIRPVYYEDLAFGCRVIGPERRGILYEPAARVLHRHTLTLDQYLDREELLGLMAPVVARVCPEAFAVLMANRSAADIAHDFKNKMDADTSVYQQIYRRLEEKFAESAESLGQGAERENAIEALYKLHIPIRLYAFRLGFLRGMELADDSCWKQRQPQNLWRNALKQR